MSPLLVGEVVVASVAAMSAALELWSATVRRSSEHAWAGLVCAGTAAYAALQFFYFQAGTASDAVILQKLQNLALGVLTLSVFEYGATRRGLRRRWTRRVARTLMLLSFVPTLATGWFVSSQVQSRTLDMLDHGVLEAPATFPLGTLFLASCLLLAASGAHDLLKAERRSWPLVAGLSVWVLSGLHDLLQTTGVINEHLYVLEYGFLGFAVALVGQHAAEYSALLDQSERARAALARQNRDVEELSHTVVLRVEEGIVFVDAHGIVRLWNPMMVRISGRSADRSVGRHYSELLSEAPHGPALREAVERMLHTHEAQSIEVKMPNGVATSLAVVPASSDATNQSFIVVVRDISRQRDLTKRMMEMDRMIAAGTLAAGVGHEINNPLSYVTTNLEVARERLAHRGDPLDHELGELLGEAAEGARRIRDVVGQLRAMVRPDEHAEPRAVPLARVLDWAAKMAEGEIRSRATVVRDYDTTASALGVESELGQVFLNLVLNAAHAIQPGAAPRNHIRLSVKRDGRVVRVEVADTGAGIVTDQLDRIFEPFFTTKPAEQGTGLGLAIVRRIVQQHGGRIEVDSTPGKGTRFVVELPAAAATRSLHAPAPDDQATARLRVLIVDDDALVARSLARSLKRKHDVALCMSGAEALAHLARDRRFDLVLSDIMMGDMDGIELFRRVEHEFPGLRGHVVLMTGGLLTAEARRFAREHPDRVVHKPLEHADLVRLLAQYRPEPAYSREAASTTSAGCAART